MPLDASTVSCLCRELSAELTGARIEKVQQPASDTVVLSVRGQHGGTRVLLSAGSGTARVHLATELYDNPQQPPMFCMLLRKHLTGARILEIRQPGFERMLEFRLSTLNELGVESEELLEAELIGSASNLALVGSDGRIIDCIRRYGSLESGTRCMLPGMLYEYPRPQNKLLLTEADVTAVRALAEPADRSRPPEKWLLNTLAGLSPALCRELAFRAGDSYENLPMVVDAFRESLQNGECSPYLVLQEDKPIDFSCLAMTHYGNAAVSESCESFSRMLEIFYTRRSKAEILRRNSHELFRSMKNARDRLQRKLAGQREELKKTENREELRHQAELITANIWKIRKGDRVLECEDYDREDCPLIRIELDPMKNPQQNAALRFKQYNKMKSAEQHLTVLIREAEEQLEYLNSVLAELDTALSEKDIQSIRMELTATGWLRRQKNEKKTAAKQQAPYSFQSSDGYEIRIGRSNLQNDELTFRLARRTDLWLHVQKIHGSHVVISADGTDIPENTILEAAEAAAWFSQGREAGKIPVDYTQIRFVRKPSGALPGKVIYTDYRTVYVEPSKDFGRRFDRK